MRALISEKFATAAIVLSLSAGSLFVLTLSDSTTKTEKRIPVTSSEFTVWIASNEWNTKFIEVNNVCIKENRIEIRLKYQSNKIIKNNKDCNLRLKRNADDIVSVSTRTQISADSEIIVHREKYTLNKLRKFGLLTFILPFLALVSMSRLRKPKGYLTYAYYGLILTWAIFGPAQYDENWITLTASRLDEFGWFNNIYSANNGPIPQAFIFNLLTYIGLLVFNSQFTVRFLWAVTAAIGLTIFLRIIKFYNLDKKIEALATAQYLLCILFLAGGWRPEILIIALWNLLILRLNDKKISTKSKLLLPLIIGISITSGQAGIAAISFILIFYIKRKISIRDLRFLISATLLSVVLLTFAQASPRVILSGINSFRASSEHAGNPLFREFWRYAPSYLSADTLGKLVAITFLIYGMVFAFKNFGKDALFVVLAATFLLFTPSKWIWHIAPLTTPVIVLLLSIKSSRNTSDFNYQSFKKFAGVFAILIVWCSVLGAQDSGYYPQYKNILFILPPAVLMSLILFLYFRKNWTNYSFLSTHTVLFMSTYLMLITFFILSSYSWKNPFVGPLITRIAEGRCPTLESYSALDESKLIPVDDIEARHQRFSDSLSMQQESSQIKLSFINEISNPQNSRYVLYLKFPKGGKVTIKDQSGAFVQVSKFKRSLIPATRGVITANWFENKKFLSIDNVHIPASSSFQEFQFSGFRKIPQNLEILYSGKGVFMHSKLFIGNFVNLLSEVDSTQNSIIIPPIVPVLGCNSTIHPEDILPSAPEYIFHLPNVWFKESQPNYLFGIYEALPYLNKSINLNGSEDVSFILGKKL
jgi:hypothetical protein